MSCNKKKGGMRGNETSYTVDYSSRILDHRVVRGEGSWKGRNKSCLVYRSYHLESKEPHYTSLRGKMVREGERETERERERKRERKDV